MRCRITTPTPVFFLNNFLFSAPFIPSTTLTPLFSHFKLVWEGIDPPILILVRWINVEVNMHAMPASIRTMLNIPVIFYCYRHLPLDGIWGRGGGTVCSSRKYVIFPSNINPRNSLTIAATTNKTRKLFLMFASCCMSITNNTNSIVNATVIYLY
jgi:hypothetical protein